MLKAVKFTRKQNGAVLTFCTSLRVIRYVVIGYFVGRPTTTTAGRACCLVLFDLSSLTTKSKCIGIGSAVVGWDRIGHSVGHRHRCCVGNGAGRRCANRAGRFVSDFAARWHFSGVGIVGSVRRSDGSSIGERATGRGIEFSGGLVGNRAASG